MSWSGRMMTSLLFIGLEMTALGSARGMPGSEPRASASLETDGQAASTQPPSPRPNPDASGKYHIGDGVSAPRFIYSVDPEFTDKARHKKLSGTCTIGMLVDETGRPQDVHIVKSIAVSATAKLRSTAEGLDANAVEAARQYRFTPATYQGKPVPVEITVEIYFRSF
jgi:TonB family protein